MKMKADKPMRGRIGRGAAWKHRLEVCASLLLLATSALAGPRSSANYSIATDTTNSGGRRATSANYTNDGSIGGLGSVSTVASPPVTAKAGYIGQLYELVGFVVSASPSTIAEGETRALDAGGLLDDSTLLAIDPALVSWTVLSGPIVSISASGLATAGLVYQNTPASVRGTYEGNPSPFNLTVLNASLDDFESYAGDSIDDDWQVLYFGLPPNANAGPNADVSGTGQTNLFKYIAGLNPLDPNSRFTLHIAPVPDPLHPGQFLAGQKNLTFSPRFTDRNYVVKFKLDLAGGTWSSLPGSTFSDNGQERTVTDPSASGSKKFYQVEITKP